MERSFWQERWDTGHIGFHEGKPNALLQQHADLLAPAARVLVPLAGKAHDLLWLARRGHAVVGVEIVERACREFFAEHGTPMEEEERDDIRAFRSTDAATPVELWCADFLALTPARCGTFGGLYDRAALVALSPATRARYVETCASLLEPGAGGLLITFDYDQSKLEGPPWSVPLAEVQRLYQRHFRVQEIVSRETTINPRFVEAGVRGAREVAVALTCS
ncbi:MAG: thiopurine S-methyltransferase [Deltaproteobacteria bacterium]|nr:thiopurine S-methyltransferase [Deltaproteobacteria bacterium]